MDGEFPLTSNGQGILDLQRPTVQSWPLVIASPHSGTEYPAEFLAASRLDPLSLRRSEDSFVDELFASAPSLGVPLLSARFPRAYVDVNREAYELDPSMFCDALPGFVNAGSPRVRMGLGTIARLVASGEEIYTDKLHFAEVQRRIERHYRPYHQTLNRLVEETEARFGGCLLVDCHSMPSGVVSGCGRTAADFVLGDCHGGACAAEIRQSARRFLAERGYTVAINTPYAGGFTTDHYGRPDRRRHALQIEINRALYMNEQNYRRKPYFGRLARELTELVAWLSQTVQECLAKPDAVSA
jgi:N-formylglutamate amidohydrolase